MKNGVFSGTKVCQRFICSIRYNWVLGGVKVKQKKQFLLNINSEGRKSFFTKLEVLLSVLWKWYSNLAYTVPKHGRRYQKYSIFILVWILNIK